jgi:uncharacterized Zn finger protein (UPF0148 family)
MNKTCDLCGYKKEGFETDGKFYCISCLEEILPEQYPKETEGKEKVVNLKSIEMILEKP